MVVPNAKKPALFEAISANIGKRSTIYSDQFSTYYDLKDLNEYTHKTVNHMVEYVNGKVHTQGIENFWSLLKRGLFGTYVSVEPYHLGRYLDEQIFRYNNRRKMDDEKRFAKVLSQVAGKRLTYAEVTGKVGETAF